MQRPNILYLHSHDTGRYLQPYGHAIPTPAIQRLTEQGTLFRQAFCAAPTCSPSRAALLTGQSAHSSGMLGLAHRGFGMSDYSRHIAHVLRPAGYQSVLAGMQHIAKDANVIGYDRVMPGGGTGAETRAVEFLGSAPKQPFFLDVGFNLTHRAGVGFHRHHDPADPRYCLPPAPLPDTPRTRADMAEYKASARSLDDHYATVLGALDRAGITDNTLVVCTTDHGIAFPAMKCNLTDHGLGVSLIIRGPAGSDFNGGKVVDAMISQIDIVPTICQLLGIAVPPWVEGRSFLPVIRGEADEVNDEIFGEVSYHAAYEPQRAVRTRRWKYIRRFGERSAPVMPNCDDCISKDELVAHGWRDREVAFEQLYDLVLDPCESRNLVGAADEPAALAEMRRRLEDWMKRTNDPLLQGPVALPAGGITTDPSRFSPDGKK